MSGVRMPVSYAHGDAGKAAKMFSRAKIEYIAFIFVLSAVLGLAVGVVDSVVVFDIPVLWVIVLIVLFLPVVYLEERLEILTEKDVEEAYDELYMTEDNQESPLLAIIGAMGWDVESVTDTEVVLVNDVSIFGHTLKKNQMTEKTIEETPYEGGRTRVYQNGAPIRRTNLVFSKTEDGTSIELDQFMLKRSSLFGLVTGYIISERYVKKALKEHGYEVATHSADISFTAPEER